MKKVRNIPLYTITDKIVNLTAEISELVGVITVKNNINANPKLRRDNRIRTIHATLAIENNSLSLEQVTDVIDGKRVLGKPYEIQEVKNAYKAYERLLQYNPYSVQDLLDAHRLLMTGLIQETGVFRQGGVGVFAGERLVHMAPPAKQVPQLITELLQWTEKARLHPLIKSCVFHYEFEFIHPFADGNGRMGRMWQTLLLAKWKPFFAWLPVETLIRERQDEYYRALALSDKNADAQPLAEFLLQVILAALKELAETEQVSEQATVQVRRLLEALGTDTLSGRELMKRLDLKHRPTFRNNYLVPALEQKLITMTVPDKPNSSKQKYRRV
ncbi:MAG TPA: Fic family protein [Peptococcaceae bacterium]|jgi:Fic family protein|nr:Fic family protein [Clostridia bacterium]HOB82016.1 Fic family protein [Peptococcaceae bacterium]HPZ70631.1 Fic family protein [Peptococcaceae bacterium]HQD54242.1 Fic family protein [Peptococcaceae bacterium]